MATMQNQYSPLSAAPGMGTQRTDNMDWSQEISPAPPAGFQMAQRPAAGTVPATAGPQLDIKHNLSADVIESPTTTGEAHAGSWKAMLGRNLGNYVVATFLIGTQGTTNWEGVLYDVGNDYLVIYQAGRDRYIVCDLYSLKYIEFYDTDRRQMCNELLRQNGWQANS